MKDSILATISKKYFTLSILNVKLFEAEHTVDQMADMSTLACNMIDFHSSEFFRLLTIDY